MNEPALPRSTTQAALGRTHMSIDDELTLLMLAPVLFAAFAGTVSATAVSWLIEHRVLVPATRALIRLPGGAGLDGARLLVLLGAFVLLVAWRGRRRQHAAGHEPPATAP